MASMRVCSILSHWLHWQLHYTFISCKHVHITSTKNRRQPRQTSRISSDFTHEYTTCMRKRHNLEHESTVQVACCLVSFAALNTNSVTYDSTFQRGKQHSLILCNRSTHCCCIMLIWSCCQSGDPKTTAASLLLVPLLPFVRLWSISGSKAWI